MCIAKWPHKVVEAISFRILHQAVDSLTVHASTDYVIYRPQYGLMDDAPEVTVGYWQGRLAREVTVG